MQQVLSFRYVLAGLTGALALAPSSHAQGILTFQPGYVLLEGRTDTLRGAVEQPNRLNAATGLAFQSRPGDATSRVDYPVQRLRGAGIRNGATYEVKKIAVSFGQFLGQPTPGAQPRPDTLTVLMQVLVRGRVNLYRLEYDVRPNETTAMNVTAYEHTFFFAETANRPPVWLSEASFRTVLPAYFADCSTAVRPSRLTEADLSTAVLAYNRCAPGRLTADLRPVVAPPPPLQRFWALRLGTTYGSVTYADVADLDWGDLDARLGFAAGGYLRLASRRPWSLNLGVEYAYYRGQRTTTATVPGYLLNANEQLQLVRAAAAHSVLTVVLSQATLGKTQRLYVLAGPAVGLNFRQAVRYDYFAYTAVPGAFVNKQVVARYPLDASRSNLLLAATVGLGVRQPLGSHHLLLDLRYQYGREALGNDQLGPAVVQGLSLRAGLEF